MRYGLRTYLPEAVARRTSKAIFTRAFWRLAYNNREDIRDILLSSSLRLSVLMDAKALREECKAAFASSNPESPETVEREMYLYRAACAEAWLRSNFGYNTGR